MKPLEPKHEHGRVLVTEKSTTNAPARMRRWRPALAYAVPDTPDRQLTEYFLLDCTFEEYEPPDHG